MDIVEAMVCGVIPIIFNYSWPSEILSGDLTSNMFSEDRFQDGAIAVLFRANSEPEYLEN